MAESVVHTQDAGNPESGDPNRRDFIYIAAGAAAVIVASLLRSPPIYDALRERMLRAGHPA